MSEPKPGMATEEDAVALGRTVGVGCFSLFVGTWSGAMVAVLVGRFVEAARKAPACEGLPLCNWHVYAGVGAVVGAVSLPILVLRRMRQRRPTQRTDQG